MPFHFPTFNAWRDAEQAAHAADQELYNLMVRSGMCGNLQRLKDQAAAAELLRRKAHALFDEAMREMKERADLLHHRHVLGHGAAAPNSGATAGQ